MFHALPHLRIYEASMFMPQRLYCVLQYLCRTPLRKWKEADRKAAWVGLRLIHATVDFQLASVLWNPQTAVGGESG